MLPVCHALRVRDTCEEIRAVVVDGVGNWTLLYPAVYLRDLYLKYLGWALSDKVTHSHPNTEGVVRLGLRICTQIDVSWVYNERV